MSEVPLGHRHIVAMGGGISPGAPALYKYVLSLVRKRKSKPHVLFMTTATGDDTNSLLFHFRVLSMMPCVITQLGFFQRTPPDLNELIRSQDAIIVGGGNTKSMLAVWREYGVDISLRQAWEQGVVLAGSSAGGICWFDACVTDSFAESFTALPCLGILKGSCCPHYDGARTGEKGRQSTYHNLIISGALADGYAIEEVTGCHFVGQDLHEVVTAAPGGAAYKVTLRNGKVSEKRLPGRFLTDLVDA